MSENKQLEVIAGGKPEEQQKVEKFVSPVDPLSGQLLMNPKTKEPFKSQKEIEDHKAEQNAKLKIAIQMLTEVFEHYCIVITGNGIIYATRDPASELGCLCKMAADELNKQTEMVFRAFGFGEQKPMMPVLERIIKAKSEERMKKIMAMKAQQEAQKTQANEDEPTKE